MNNDELKITERLFRALTDTDDSNRRIRRPAYLSEIEGTTGANRGTIMKIIQRFQSDGRSFLVVSEDKNKEDSLVDISH